MGDMPVAMVDYPDGIERVTYLHADHLNTPRYGTNQAGAVVWQWQSDAFGNGMPNEDVDGDGVSVQVNLRFPGQYYDAESSLHYNWNRYYDPSIGRYITSDPIGLYGGLNTYAYVEGNPMNRTDPTGLLSCGDPGVKCDFGDPAGAKPKCITADCSFYNGTSLKTKYFPSIAELNETTKEEYINAAVVVGSGCGGAAFVAPKVFVGLSEVALGIYAGALVLDPSQDRVRELAIQSAPYGLGKVSNTIGDGASASMYIHDAGIKSKELLKE